MLNLEINGPAAMGVRFVILDALGKQLLEGRNILQPGVQRTPISVHGISKGLYSIKMVGDDGTKTIRFYKR